MWVTEHRCVDIHTLADETSDHEWAGGESRDMDIKSMIIGALLVAVAVLGYLVYDAQRTKVKIDLPGVKIEGH